MKKILTFTLLLATILVGCKDTSGDGSSSTPSDVTPGSEVTSGTDNPPVSEDVSSGPVDSEQPTTSIPNSDIEPVNAYYNSINGMEIGTTLQTSLRSLITNTHKTEVTYDGLRNVFGKTDADKNKSGNIHLFYTGTSVAFSGSFSGQVNREHVWPKNAGKAFPEKSKAGSDAHHLRPTDNSLNSTRGSLSFGIVPQTSSSIVKQNGSTTYATGDYLSYKSSSLFYPGKGYRGATARILFYVQVRWGSAYNLDFVLGAGSNKTIGDMEALMKWHLEEPPSEHEMIRNEEVFKIQGNRNPFIDVPEYAGAIYANNGKGYSNTVKSVLNNYA